MASISDYTACFCDVFDVQPDVAPTLKYQSIDAWDSVGHMSLMSQLEDTFEILLDMDDIIDFSSYEKGIELLQKYSVDFS